MWPFSKTIVTIVSPLNYPFSSIKVMTNLRLTSYQILWPFSMHIFDWLRVILCATMYDQGKWESSACMRVHVSFPYKIKHNWHWTELYHHRHWFNRFGDYIYTNTFLGVHCICVEASISSLNFRPLENILLYAFMC